MKVSVVCPFFNESLIITKASQGMLEGLRALSIDWELIAVNDGSRDDSLALIQRVFEGEPRARVISYPVNQGRGHALKTGIDAATGDIIVTTEIDLSWGESIVKDILEKFSGDPGLDVVVASPNLPGGGYRNVPVRRVLISRAGNLLIRALFTKRITMNTGMTRGYRRAVIQGLHTDEKGKEFHLEVLLKLFVLGYRLGEIPATLEWKDHRLAEAGKPKRKSSSKIPKLIFSHLNFAVFANPIRYFWALSMACAVGGGAFLAAAFYRLLVHDIAIYLALTGFFLGMFALVFFGFGVTSAQNSRILKELWRRRS